MNVSTVKSDTCNRQANFVGGPLNSNRLWVNQADQRVSCSTHLGKELVGEIEYILKSNGNPLVYEAVVPKLT
jgi:hypothetical protein